MKRISVILCILVGLCLNPALLVASPTTPEQARQVVAGWLSLESGPMKTDMGKAVAAVSSYDGADGQAAYYIVYTQPRGFVIVPADDEVEPIIGFSTDGTYDPSPQNPLGALVSQDVPGRVAFVRGEAAKNREATDAGSAAKARWAMLSLTASGANATETGTATISDIRVAPLVQSTWDQSTAGGVNTYNIYTPSNYVCGCVATAMSQLMRFHQHPTAGVGTTSFNISVCGTPTTRALRGGNGSGGAYLWADMVLSPGAATTTAQRQAIGALSADAGVSVNMDYCSSSGTDTLLAAGAFKTTFGYSNAVKGYNSGSNLPADSRNRMVNPNLDAGYPVLFGITGDGGHAIVCDGYGYESSTMYHHLNMGWSGSDNLWYNLPTIETTYYNFNSVYKCVYNVYVTGTGEIVSGRVTDSGGNPIAGATVTATRTGGGTYTDTTDAKGIYALSKVPSASTYTIAVSKSGYTFTSKQATTSNSVDNTTTTGNVWGVDFTGTGGGGGGGGANLMLLDVPAAIIGAGASSGGFNEQFTGTLANWTQHGGTWTIGGGYASMAGTAASVWSTLSYNVATYSGLDYSVRMRRATSAYNANAVFVRGAPTPLDSVNRWYSGYYFAYTNGGSYQVGYWANGGVFTSYTGWVSSALIVPYGWNILRVVASGTALTFYLNGTQVYTVSDSNFSTGRVGFGRYDDAGGALDVDYATLSTVTAGAGAVAGPAKASPITGVDDTRSP